MTVSFPTGHAQYCDVNGEVVEMPTNKRRFMKGNALVVDLMTQGDGVSDSF